MITIGHNKGTITLGFDGSVVIQVREQVAGGEASFYVRIPPEQAKALAEAIARCVSTGDENMRPSTCRVCGRVA